MISYIEGRILDRTPNKLTILTGGVGYECTVSPRTSSELEHSETAALQIQSIHKEATGTELFGFLDSGEKTLFKLLMEHVSGVGPKTALSLLNGIRPDDFRSAVVNNTPATLAKIKGVGVKTAERIILELRDKIKLSGAVKPSSVIDAVLALTGLGQTKAAAEKAVETAVKHLGENTSLENLVREALLSQP